MLHRMSYGPDQTLENKLYLSCVFYVLSTMYFLAYIYYVISFNSHSDPTGQDTISLLQIMLRRLKDISEVPRSHS